jgi:hypothetical protein
LQNFSRRVRHSVWNREMACRVGRLGAQARQSAMQIRSPLRLFELEDAKRLNSLKVGKYTLKRPRCPWVLQDLLFAYTRVIQGRRRRAPRPRARHLGIAYGPSRSPEAKVRSIQPTACSTSPRASIAVRSAGYAGPSTRRGHLECGASARRLDDHGSADSVGDPRVELPLEQPPRTTHRRTSQDCPFHALR